jgi:hypothetical protein
MQVRPIVANVGINPRFNGVYTVLTTAINNNNLNKYYANKRRKN